MNRITILKISVLIVAGICLVVFLYFRIQKETKVPNEPEPTTGITFPPNDDNTEAPIETNIQDVLSRPETINLGGGSYIIAGGNSFTEIPPYQIVFYGPDQSYTISLQELPLSQTRIVAERALLTLLNSTEKSACLKSIMVTVPFDVSNEYSGQNLGLSFCSGSIILR